MKLIVGLGNPGKKYAKNRHNVGWMVLEHMLEKSEIRNSKLQTNPKSETRKELKSEICEIKIGSQPVVLAKPLTFMNNSGWAVKALSSKLQTPRPTRFATRSGRANSKLYLIHDDLDIPLGSFKIQFGRGPKDHKGIESVEKALGTKEFWRVRVGIENRNSELSGEDYVLGKFTKEELKILEKVIAEVVGKLLEEVKGWDNLDRVGGRV